jgi:hypothetical protein
LWKSGKNSNVLMHEKIVFVKKWILVPFVLIDISILFQHSYLVIYILKFTYFLFKRQNKHISRICVLGVAILSFFYDISKRVLNCWKSVVFFVFHFITTEFNIIYSCNISQKEQGLFLCTWYEVILVFYFLHELRLVFTVVCL